MYKTPLRMAAVSLVALLLLACVAPVLAKDSTGGTSRKTVTISPAAITYHKKFVDRKGKTHVRFRFEADGKDSGGIIFEGNWNSDTIAALESKRVSMTGYWKEYKGKPSFVARKIVKLP